ncbi:MAG TPA: MazG family protein [Actinomycetales bacterium]|nr:MazG family protein [Actinomycetales bacterium]
MSEDAVPAPPAAEPDLTLLLTSPRTAPGQLTRSAWQALDRATTVLCSDVTDPQPAALRDAGLHVSAAVDVTPPALATTLVQGASEGTVVWVGSPDGDPGLTDALAAELSRVASGREPPSVEVLVGSHDVPGARLLDLVVVMDRLRSPGGCPWDAQQTHTSLVPYLVEEAFEAVEAVETTDRTAMREELGDVLLQVVFHARIGQEHPDDPFDIDDVADGIVAKLVHRHPHVFGAGADAPDAPDVTAESVETSWEVLKAAEKARASVLDGVPAALPALARADKVVGRVERAGLDVDGLLRSAQADGAGTDPASAALGQALVALVRRCRAEGIDPEAVLREQVRRLEDAARAAEGSGRE